MTAFRFLRAVVILAVCGLPLSVIWWAVAPVEASRWTGSGFLPTTTEPDAFIAADVLFGLLMLVFGLVSGWWLRRRWSDTPAWALVALFLGTLGASALTAWCAAAWGPSAAPNVAIGALVDAPLRVRSPGLLLIAPIAATAWWFAADLIASWREADDDTDEPASTPARSGPSSLV